MSARPQLGEFLQSRRARVRPEDVGLRPGNDRRVAGLRREEVALLASVSVDYYVRLEQGRAGNPSTAVLTAVADALRLDQAERDHLRQLACSAPPAVPPTAPVRPQLKAMIEAMPGPAILVDRLSNVLAWNAAALEVVADFNDPAQRNLARLYFLDPSSREYYADWETVAQDAVALLQRAAAEYADDTELDDLVDELRTASPDFDRFWTTQNVQNRSHCPKTLNHPTGGELTFTLESLQLPGDDGQYVITYTPADPATTTWLTDLHSPLSQS
ncbi:helix-turn-helix transcriptional regulator [Kribbella speibonae]|uniref:XRE family transcriptional regulator n=1 Tax=Kribbella speibonae TaxID=1572660 RepID=A0A4R0IHX4_9ACTN|nr:helix-turn-helix transcriptional regulator [Kribbella speibonae]TCC19619.1 XRE family transcriptional regulator [Kribbella speibonae]TCC31724.1 XRE family transcriptional regulator [Kribbella speibonae]